VNITRHEIEPLNDRLSITIEPDDYAPKVKKALANIAKNAQMKGFRKGNVPKNLLKKRYGKGILVEELNKLIDETFNKYIKEENINLIGQPISLEKKQAFDIKDTTKSYEFEFEIGMRPAITFGMLEEGNSEVFTKYNIAVTEDAVEEQIKQLRKQFGEQTSEGITDVEENDVVYIELTELDEAGNVVEEGHYTTNVVATDMLTDIGREKIVGMLLEDSIDLDIYQIFDHPKEAIAKNVLNLKEGELENAPSLFRLRVTQITRAKLAELNAEFYTKITGNANIDTLEEFKVHIKDRIMNEYNTRSNNKVLESVGDYIREKVEFNLPEGYVQRLNERYNEDNAKKEDFKPVPLSDFTETIKYELLTQALADKFEVKIEENDMNQAIKQESMYRVAKYFGGKIPSYEFIEQVEESIKKDQNQINNIYKNLQARQINESLLKSVNVAQEDITLEAFNELNKKDTVASDEVTSSE